jgi:cytochrome c biogenesis protein
MSEKAKEARSGMEARWYRTLGSKIWYFFNSLKLTLFVLIALAVVSIFGTVVEQNAPVEQYVTQYGEQWTKYILYTRLNDMYHAWWFLLFLAALALNIIVCTFERFPPKWKSLLDHKPEKKFDSGLIDKFSHRETVNLNASSDAVKDRLLKFFKKRKYGVVSMGTKGDYYFYAWKGRHGRLGSDVTHISLLLILAGAIVGSYAGYKDFFAVNVGGTVSVPQADFKLRLDKFWIDYYDSGQIRQYNSVLTVVEDGKDVMEKQIWVNEPLFYKGIRFYQSSYGQSWNRVQEAQISVKLKGKEGLEAPVSVKWGELTEIPGSKYSVKLVGYTGDFAYDEATNQVFSKSAEATNPAIKVEVYDGGKEVSTPWLFVKYPGIFPAIPNSDTDLVFTGYIPVMYSGISVNKDPGTNIVWLGTGVMGLGFIFAFFVYHRRIWVHVRETGKSTEVKVGGTINKNNFVLEKELKDITESLTSD